jgi:two-component system cell cycle sensor histidine kinase/response regulator CckA
MDLTVPGSMGGAAAIKKLLAIDPSVRAIVSSGYSNDPVMTDFKAYGFKGIMLKPYKIKELSETLRDVLSSAE